MTRRHKTALAVVAATAAAVIGAHALLPHHIAPAALYPDSSLSPGVVATSNISDLTQTSACGTYSQCHRQTSAAQKSQVRAEYPNCPTQQEIDHIIPLALGGADDVKNLWCQPLTNTWNGADYGYKTKDKLEAYLAIHVKSGDIAPKAAQDCILSDWVSCYQKYMTAAPSYGSIVPVTDEDDEVVE